MEYYLLSEDFLRSNNMLAFDDGIPVTKDRHGNWVIIRRYDPETIAQLQKSITQLKSENKLLSDECSRLSSIVGESGNAKVVTPLKSD